MEILALLLLGFLAMLALVPPIIRGRLENSPMVTTETFRRSMEEIGQSVVPQRQGPYPGQGRSGAAGYKERTRAAGGASAPLARPARPSSRRRAEIRRNRVMAALFIFTMGWGTTTLLSGDPWCMIFFAFSCFLLLLYWSMGLILPYLLRATSAGKRGHENRPSRHGEIHREAV